MIDQDSQVSVRDGAVYVHTTDTSTTVPLTVGDFQYTPVTSPPHAVSYWTYPYSVFWGTIDSRVERAFKIVQELMKKDIIKVKTVKDFVELVNEIAEII